jgi:hypothetical protein
VWLLVSFVFSFVFIWLLRTYRIIIRHSTIKELARFILVALAKELTSGVVYGFIFGYNQHVVMLMLVDFFLTFAFFFIVLLNGWLLNLSLEIQKFID